MRGLFRIREEIPPWQAVLYGALCIAIVYGVWWFVTAGETGEERILPPAMLSSPGETFATLESLWFERELARNLLASLRRVALGFGLAALVGIPLGVLSGCFSGVNAFFAPITIFGRNIPVAALIPLTFVIFEIGETQKVMFIFIACVAFVIADTAGAIRDVGGQYIDTAYTLGAGRLQVIMKVLFPLALPSIFNSLRVLFGLAFGYIMLAEVVKLGGESGGIGDIIITSQRRGPKEHILLVLMIIPIVALGIDRLLFWIQKELFPYRHGGSGILHRCVRASLHAWEDLKGLFWGRRGTHEKERAGKP
ncbi:MAG TPA: ABC transporter permease [Planctomycetota bacterium]|nr:ABC transporter permease [Planctomycetota bacterium]